MLLETVAHMHTRTARIHIHSHTHTHTCIATHSHIYRSVTFPNVDNFDLVLPVLLIGAKCDLQDERAVFFTEGLQLAGKYQCPFLEIR